MDFNATEVFNFIQNNHLGDFVSIVGFVITLIGFGVTIYNLRKTRTASELATIAVTNIRKDLKKVDTVAHLSSILTEMEEIKRLHRTENNEQLPEKYSKLRASLIFIKNDNNALAEEDYKILQSAIVQLRAFEKNLDNALYANKDTRVSQINISKLNVLTSNHIDKLQEVLIRVKSTIGDNL